jgi:hypothetical protein
MHRDRVLPSLFRGCKTTRNDTTVNFMRGRTHKCQRGDLRRAPLDGGGIGERH